MKTTKIFKINCPTCGAKVYSFEIVSYYFNDELKFVCPYCNK